MQIFGLVFILLGTLHYLLTVVWRVNALRDYWGTSDVPLSRLSNTIWSIVIALLGVALLFMPWPLVTLLLMLSCVPVLVVASRHDYELWKRRNPNVPVPRVRCLALFRHWNLLRWWVVLLIPPGLSAAALYAQDRLGDSLICFFLGAGVGAITLDGLFSGRLFTNRGLYTRERNPIRYWISMALCGGFYVLGCLAAFV